MRNRDRIQHAFDDLEPPGPDYSRKALAAARSGIRPSRRFQILRFSSQFALALIVLTMFGALVIGSRSFRHGASHPGQTAAHGSPATFAKSQYQEVVGNDWSRVLATYDAVDCRLPPLNGRGQANASDLPVDIPACRSQLSTLSQSVQRMKSDVDAASAPAALTNADLSLKSALDDLIETINAEVADIDRRDSGAYIADATPFVGAFRKVKSIAAEIGRG